MHKLDDILRKSLMVMHVQPSVKLSNYVFIIVTRLQFTWLQKLSYPTRVLLWV
jgi:hypothetical protein